jgi:hypothetical protein
MATVTPTASPITEAAVTDIPFVADFEEVFDVVALIRSLFPFASNVSHGFDFGIIPKSWLLERSNFVKAARRGFFFFFFNN